MYLEQNPHIKRNSEIRICASLLAGVRYLYSFPVRTYKYNNVKQTFSKGHIFERITARSVLTYLVYGGIFDSGIISRE